MDKALRFLTSGYQADIDKVLNGALFSVDYSEMVIVRDIDFYSLCEHHLLPFVAVVCEGTHLCMAMRGVEKQNSYTITSAMLGAFRDQSRTRMEFLELLKLRGGIASSGPTHSHDFDE